MSGKALDVGSLINKKLMPKFVTAKGVGASGTETYGFELIFSEPITTEVNTDHYSSCTDCFMVFFISYSGVVSEYLKMRLSFEFRRRMVN